MRRRSPSPGHRGSAIASLAAALLSGSGCIDFDGYFDDAAASASSSAASTGTGTGGQGGSGGRATGGDGDGGHAGSGPPCAGPGPLGEVTLACLEARPSAIATDGAFVYWANEDDGAIKRAPVEGGGEEVLAADQGSPCAIAVNDTHVFWRTKHGEVRRRALSGGGPQDIASDQGASCALAIDATDVYWARAEPAAVLKAPLGGGGPTTLASGFHPFVLNAFDPFLVFWTDAWVGSLYSAPKNGSQQVSLLGSGTGCGVTVDAAAVGWTLRGTGALDGSVRQVTVDGTNPFEVVGALAQPCAIVAAGSDYWFVTQIPGAGEVLRVPQTGGAAESRSVGQDEPCSITADATSVYWTTCSGGTVMKLALE